MATFKDNAGRDWRIVITAFVDRDVYQKTGYRPSDTFDPKEGVRLATQPGLFVDVVVELVRDQFAEKQCDERSFLEQMAGDALDGAAAALQEAVLDFFPPSRRGIYQKLIAAAAVQMDAEKAKAMATIDAMIGAKAPPHGR